MTHKWTSKRRMALACVCPPRCLLTLGHTRNRVVKWGVLHSMSKGLGPSPPLSFIFSQCLPGWWVILRQKVNPALYTNGFFGGFRCPFFQHELLPISKHCEKPGCQSFTLTRHYESQQTASQMWPLPALLEADGAGSDVLREGSKGFLHSSKSVA